MGITEFPRHCWENASGDESRATMDLESGRVLFFPQLPFTLSDTEQAFLRADCSDRKSKNISYRGPDQPLQGALGTPQEIGQLTDMVARFRKYAEQLVDQLFPAYKDKLRPGFTSFRPLEVETRITSWRKDDTRLHVDSFPSNPTQGLRLLRVFSNVHPGQMPRTWRIGEPFEDYARRFLPGTRPLWPGEAMLLHMLGLTKSRRSEYDHLMGQLHDLGKSDMHFQNEAPQQTFNFPPGTTWVVFSDQVLHAVMAGQFMLEQTFYLHPDHLLNAATGPLATLERLTGRLHLASR